MVRIKNLPENKIFRGTFNKEGKTYFSFVKKLNNIVINANTNKRHNADFSQFDLLFKTPQHCRYFFKVYKKNILEAKAEYFSSDFLSSFTVLRFFGLKYEDMYSLKNKNRIIKKWKQFVGRYISKKNLKPIIAELRKCNCIKTILSYWPIEINRTKPWSIYNETTFRYLENLKYYNMFNIPELLTADFEGENPIVMEQLYPIWKDLIMRKKEEALLVLKKEEEEAQINNDIPVVKEIEIIRKIIHEETKNINFKDFKTSNSLFKFWPNILYPAPETAKL